MKRPNLSIKRAGIGLRAPHYQEILETKPDVGWLEVHSENFFSTGGATRYFLDQFKELYPISLHGVGLSLGSTDPLSESHLAKLKNLIQHVKPSIVSEHLCWGHAGNRHLNDLLPLPYNEEALSHIISRIQQAQDYLGTRILIENVSSYLQFKDSDISEWEFLTETCQRSGCGILLDINNIYVNSVNHQFDPFEYLAAIPASSIGEIHLAGFDSNGECLIDTHGKPVTDEVWSLYEHALKLYGPKPTLIEWDIDIPPLSVLLEEAEKASQIMDRTFAKLSWQDVSSQTVHNSTTRRGNAARAVLRKS